MTSRYKSILALLFCASVISNCRQPQNSARQEQQATAATAQQTAEVWPKLQKENRPWTRWWWMGSAVDEKNIDKLLTEYAAAGLGGVEIAPIYGAKDHESRYIDFLTNDWMRMLDFTVQKANDLGMGVDMTQGTGWPFGGPQVTPAYAASRLTVQTYTLKGGQTLQERLQVKDPKQQEVASELQALTAYNDKGERLNLLDKVTPDGKLNWKPTAGNWTLYAAFMGKTQQKVKRAAPGGVGFTLDHLSAEAVDVYLNRFEEAFQGKGLGVRAFYNDSYEVYGADWSPAFFDEFQKRRGYDLRQYLRELVGEEKSETVARIKADYRETMSDMLLENFTTRWTNWAHQRGSITKNQAHGSPGNLLDLYAAVDIPEIETFGSSYFPIPGLRRDSADIRNVDPDPIMLKFASSAAHVTGKKLTSSETFTWLGEHFKTSFAQCKPEVEQLFLSGVNHVFYHGVTYSPEDVPWPGWLFYASLNLTPANSLWPQFKGMNDYIARCQSVLQAGKADNEVLVYWPIHDFWNRPEGNKLSMITVHAIDEWLHPTAFYQQVKELGDKGYSLDFVSDKMLREAKVKDGVMAASAAATGYKVLVVPKTAHMPVSTLENMMRLAKEGTTVIFEELPADVPGFGELSSRKQALNQLLKTVSLTDAGKGLKRAQVGKGQVMVAADVPVALELAGTMRETLTDTGLKFIRRDIGNGKYYYLVNHTAKAIDTTIPVNATAASVVVMDPQSTRFGLAAAAKAGDKTDVRVQLKPGEAIILRTSTVEINNLPAWQYLEKESAPIAVQGEWQLRFTQGGPELPAPQKLKQLVSWTDLSDKRAEAFSGTGGYTTTFNLPNKNAGEYLLDLGKVSESARVWLNGQEVGYVWSIPFQARVGQFLKTGENTLKIEVANLMANRIRDMDQKKIEWRRYHEINFVNIDYKPFNASNWKPMPSGLLGPVRLIPYHTNPL